MADALPDLVIGVAGHIDHGKTSLVRALTGIETDRLPEERARGITIELGFAHCVLPGGRRAAVVDMPGHERFVRAMIAGAGGVDVLLLVVAANEGVMPQTREHLAIAGLMGVRAAVVALAKADLASDEILEIAAEEVRELLADGPLAGAQIVPVSALLGTGLDALRAALARAAVPPRTADGPALVPIDRVFVRKGFGAVVTGTLVAGRVHAGEALAIAPVGLAGEAKSVRVRGLQVHGTAVEIAAAGTRIAVNVAGLEVGEIPRGAWLYRPDAFALSRSFDAEIVLLAGTRRALGRRARLEVLVGAAHTEAVVALLAGETLAPGARALARVTTARPVVLRPGERFVLRGPPSLAGVGSTVGGGVVLRPVAERVRRREIALERARRAAETMETPRERALVEADAAGARGLSAAELQARAGLPRSALAAPERVGLVALAADRYVAASRLETLGQTLLQKLSAHHADAPASQGLEIRALRIGDEALTDAVLARLAAARKIERVGEAVRRAGFRPRDPDAVPHLPALAATLAGAGLTPPRPEEIARALGTDAKALEPALKRLLEQRSIAKINAELYVDAAALDALEARLRAYLAAHGTIDAQGFKELTGATRKWTIPLAEYFDGRKVTLRVGDVRKLRGQ